MISDAIIIINNNNISFDRIMYLIVIHFGKNPRNGGSPPILNIIIKNDIFSVIFIDFILNWLVNIMLYLYKFIHNIIFIIEYIII